MDEFSESLLDSLKTGFIDQSFTSKKEYLPELLVNDTDNGKKVLKTITRELKNCDEFWFSVAFATKSGVTSLINSFQELENAGINGKILVSQYQYFTQPEALRALSKFKNIDLKIAVDCDFHAKGYLFRKSNRYNLIIGSSNLTANALCSNKEWNLKISATPDSKLIVDSINEFRNEFENAVLVDDEFIESYALDYNLNKKFISSSRKSIESHHNDSITPNSMQKEALENLKDLRSNNKDKALLISATGTGKTYLSAFDVKAYNPKKFLFVVHRRNIAENAMKSFEKIFGDSRSMGLYSGNEREINADFIFSTIQTISRDEHLRQFNESHFDYIVIDETHRAGAKSYQKILNYFKPKFLLGMTATPERTDGFDIFSQFEHTIAYEIRLHRALEEKMLSNFHYFGVTDVTVDGQVLDEDAAFSLLTAKERVDRIIENAEFYGCDNGCVRGLIFCSRVDESQGLSDAFNTRGYKTISLSGKNSEEERINAINRLESYDPSEKLDYIFTVDIFNEGVDIPKVNQIIMLRPTASAIIFVQQLGRGLRKANDKEYLTVIDFIGNYNNSYLVPIALYGDTTYNKDTLRKLMLSGSSLIPGASTINFDKITHERIFTAIDKANLHLKKDLVKDYELLKFKIGSIPMMMDFVEHGSRDPQLYAKYLKSYFNFVSSQEESLQDKLSKNEVKLLELFSNEIANTKRVEEVVILKKLISQKILLKEEFKAIIFDKYGISLPDETIESSIKNINFEFVTENHNRKLVSVSEKYDLNIISYANEVITFNNEFIDLLKNETFLRFLNDMLDYSETIYNRNFDKNKYVDGFLLYQKYSRKDVFRILNWDKNPLAQNVGGYLISPQKTNCPIFVNYHKEEDISSTTKYEDGFVNNSEFEWMSKSGRKLDSKDVATIRNYRKGLRLPLFIKKSNGESNDFYYMGDVTPIDESFEQTNLVDDNNKNVSVVKVKYRMNHPVEDSIYDYITAPSS
ncbi:DEAD/DEAH box helicase [Methanococcoides alaskense]|uniref:Superfamily II DNA or RNA helicase/HKD family nuclease n=1 Tax=Methanococcoides alaskense TaxID=325778 RepID=A0AA90TYD3_9EURY|nr:DEAD/DEAH box helicase [Methanococcoides alaskense]MDA0524895.1 DEAD/DEAH box helicase [Methanococcoides alaskense]MDR6222191.1 superfamily II DNA or RNA helicase/HKD family nuclease [Methanococcoides alaskense]